MSKEKGILFTSESIQAIMRKESPKTQTRRVLNPQPPTGYHLWGTEVMGGSMPFTLTPRQGEKGEPVWIKLPYQVGDVLYCRETWGYTEGQPEIYYKADPLEVTWRAEVWKSSRFMFKKYARIWLEVLAVRVERLQDISEEDAIAEGVGPWEAVTEKLREIDKQVSARHGWPYPRYRNSFREAWDKVNAKRGYSWESSPWVAVYTFRRIER